MPWSHTALSPSPLSPTPSPSRGLESDFSPLPDCSIDVKNINLQIKKKQKTCFFTFIKKNIKNMHETLNYNIHSSKKNRQYKSNKVDITATKHSFCLGNGR